MIIQKSASWVMNYKAKSLGELNSMPNPSLDQRLDDILKLKDEINNQIQKEIDYIYMIVNNRINK
jgi:TolB-like protein